MATVLTIQMRIPVPGRNQATSSLTFSQWLPLKSEDFIHFQDGEISGRLWFDLTCLAQIGQVKQEDLSRMLNIGVQYIFVEICVSVDEDLTAYIFEQKGRPGDSSPLSLQYEELGKTVLTCALKNLNSLLAFARGVKGQYWIGNYEISCDRMPSDFLVFQAKVQTPGGWLKLTPGTSINLGTLSMPSSERFINPDDWQRAREFIANKSHEPLVGRLLANAEALAVQMHTRSSIIDAITALEVALNRFAASPYIEHEILQAHSKRLGVQSLKSMVDHLGLTGSCQYLLPLIVPESLLPNETLKGCWEAIALRQTVVHQGQREVRKESLTRCLKHVRKTCQVLATLTRSADDG